MQQTHFAISFCDPRQVVAPVLFGEFPFRVERQSRFSSARNEQGCLKTLKANHFSLQFSLLFLSILTPDFLEFKVGKLLFSGTGQ